MAKPTPIYSVNKDLIESNYQKALLKLENLLIKLAQVQKNEQNNSDHKKDALIRILASLEL